MDGEQRLDLSKHEIESTIKTLRALKALKYPRSKRRSPIYGDLDRSFSTEQLFSVFDELRRFGNNRVRDQFLIMFFYGLRIGELADLEYLERQRLLKIVNHKPEEHNNYLPVIPGTEPLFESLEGKPYHQGYLATYFKETLMRLGDEYYSSYGQCRQKRNLHQYTSHSLRKTAGNIFLKSTGGKMYKMHRFLRHDLRSVYAATGWYTSYSEGEFRVDLEEAFTPYIKGLL